MDLPISIPRRLLHLFVVATILPISLSQASTAATVPLPNPASDRLTLLSFKSLISDPSRSLSSWDNATLHFCQWRGVTCGRQHAERVTSLRLESLNLTGPVPPHIANLSFLRQLRLGDNSFVGTIPPELGRLSRLRLFNLSFNYLEGEIPSNLTRCSELWVISLVVNDLTSIPTEIGLLSKLQLMTLSKNNLIGGIPQSIGNLSSLQIFYALEGGLRGSIPSSIGRLSSLLRLQLGNNKLSGEVPSSIYNLSSIEMIILGTNRLTGSLPSNLFNLLPNLQYLQLYENQLHGSIPASLPNATNIVEFDITTNNFTGSIPSNLGNLQYLTWIELGNNQLETRDLDFLASLTNCTLLKSVILQSNRLAGNMPSSISNFSSNLQDLSMGWNKISGSLPNDIDNLVNLNAFALAYNRLTGSIPAAIGRLQQLNLLSMPGNRLTGQIPRSIGNLTRLTLLYLEGNYLNGSIPESFENCRSLEELNLSRNKLTGAIPGELLSLSSLSTRLDLSYNFFTGSLPLEVGKLTNLNGLDISNNRMSGALPSTLGGCQSLEYLYLQDNSFNGTIPQSLSSLKGLLELDLSHNRLSGEIPEYLARLSGLLRLNLSFNNLEGKVPNGGIFRNVTAVAVIGNKNLCGGSEEIHLPACYTDFPRRRNKNKSLLLKVVIPILGAAACLVSLIVMYAACRRVMNSREKSSFTPLNEQFMKATYSELLKATDGFSQSNLIGAGSVGSVYKGTMAIDGRTVAVKVLNLQVRGASKSFMAECEVLRNVRHRNLLKVLTACSSVDFKGNDFKALVLEFMPNGSLESWLHPAASEFAEPANLSFTQRLDIAIDAASALEYLHHHGQTPIVHCDLKPSNVLLDTDMCAHVGDFGLARFLWDGDDGPDEQQTRSTGVNGTIGYIPPEYGVGGEASTHGDVYSYGILLLELFTGLRPTDEKFNDGMSLYNNVEMAFPDKLVEIVDPRLRLSMDGQEAEGNDQERKDIMAEEFKCLVTVIGIALSCSKQDPKSRMVMECITKEMHSARERLLKEEK